MPRLVNNVSGTAANTDSVLSPPSTPVNPAVVVPNVDPLNVESSLLYTVYAWAATWGGAQIALFVSPQSDGSQIPDVWFPLLNAAGQQIVLSANGYINFSVRYGEIVAQVSGAGSTTAGLCCTLFNPSLAFPAGTP